MLAGTNAANGYDNSVVWIIQRTDIVPEKAGIIEAAFRTMEDAERYLEKKFGKNHPEASYRFFDVIRYHVG